MLLLDMRRRCREVNGAYLTLIGYPRSALVGRPIWELVHGGPRFSPKQFDALVARGEFAGRVDLIRSDGRIVVVQYAAHAEVVTGKRQILAVALHTTVPGHVRREAHEPTAALSGRELEIVRLVALGWTGPEVADELQISHNTVRTHIAHAMDKLGARSRAHLVAKSLGDGLVLT